VLNNAVNKLNNNPTQLENLDLYKTPVGKKPEQISQAEVTPLPPIPEYLFLYLHSSEGKPAESTTAKVPYWARTPALNAALFNQKTTRPEDVFGKVQPIKLEGNQFTNF
jgi:hypothetical protein